MIVLYPDLGNIPDFYDQKTIYFQFVKRCIARNIYFRNKNANAYVGCLVTHFTMYPDLIRKHFPFAKIVIPVRNPSQCFPSYCDLCVNIMNQPFGEKFT